MFTTKSALTVTRNVGLLALLVAVLALCGCSCKEFEEQIVLLDQQIADLQGVVAEREATISEKEQIAAELEEQLAALRGENAALVEQLEEVVMITVDEKLMFVSSGDFIREEMVPTLQVIANVLSQHPTWDVYVQGHTDNKKIYEEFQEKWATNWELGAYRACSVVRYLTNELGMSADRFAAVSYGPFHPIGDNETPEGRSENRRVTFLMHKPEH